MNTVKKLICTTGVAAAVGVAPMSASAYSFSTTNFDFTIGGYAKLSALYSKTNNGVIPGGAGGTGRTIYLPSATPVGDADGQTVYDMTARESRINFKAKSNGGDHKLGLFLEMDFLTTGFGNELVSNSYSPRMRHYFFTFDNWLFGQTWSTLMDVAALPESVDFLAAPEGTVFIRQPMVRYSAGGFQVALENPETFTSGGSEAIADDSYFPDLTGNYKFKGDWGHVRLNGLVRQLKIDKAATGEFVRADDNTVGWGAGASGKFKVFGDDDIRASVLYGDGMGRYTSLGAVRDAVVDTNGNLDTVKSLAAFLAYRHMWTSKMRSSLIGSYVDLDNPDSGADTLNDRIYSVAINLIYSPVKKVDFGIMYLYANRKDDSGADGNLNRIQAMAKYSF